MSDDAIKPEVVELTGSDVLRPGELGGLQIQSVADTELNFKILIYGDSGVGKTVLAGSACVVPEMAPVLLLDIEGGTLSLRKRYPEVDAIRINTWSDLVKVYDALKAGNHEYRTVIVDSLTEAQKIGMATIMRRAVKKAEEEGTERDPDLPTIGEYGKSTNQMRQLVRLFRNLPMNVIFTCLSTRDQDKKGNWLTRPSLTQKLSSEVAGFMDVVLYMYTLTKDKQLYRLLQSVRTEGIIAKDRTDRLPMVVGKETAPTVQSLHDMMFGDGLALTQKTEAPELMFPDSTTEDEDEPEEGTNTGDEK